MAARTFEERTPLLDDCKQKHARVMAIVRSVSWRSIRMCLGPTIGLSLASMVVVGAWEAYEKYLARIGCWYFTKNTPTNL